MYRLRFLNPGTKTIQTPTKRLKCLYIICSIGLVATSMRAILKLYAEYSRCTAADSAFLTATFRFNMRTYPIFHRLLNKFAQRRTTTKRSHCLSLAVITCCAGLGSQAIYATSLIDVYNQSLQSDPTYQQAEATWLGSKAGIGLARSTLLPQLTATSDWNFAEHDNSAFASGGVTSGSFNVIHYGLTLNQPIFNFSSWTNLRKAQFQAKAEQAAYNAAAQMLISNVINAYFQVLQSYNTLHYDISKKDADYRQYYTTKQQYKVGLKAVTDVYTAQATYDSDIATVIADKNQVTNDLEALSEISGTKYTVLNDISGQIPLATPSPDDINQWINTTKRQNYTILADQATLEADKNAIRAAYGGHFPTISAQGSFAGLHAFANGKNSQAAAGSNISSRTTTIGIYATLPILGGGSYGAGSVSAQTEQARYQYVNDSAQLEADTRSAVSNTRQAYLTINQLTAKIAADKEAIISSSKGLTSTRAGYRVGTTTMNDVLLAISALNQAQQQYYADQYNFLEQVITLKQQAGILDINDVKRIDVLLSRPIQLDMSKKISMRHSGSEHYPSHGREHEPQAATTTQPKHHQQKPTANKVSTKKLAADKNKIKQNNQQASRTTQILPQPGSDAGTPSNTTATNTLHQTQITTTQLKPGNYSIQLFASRNLQQAQRFIQQFSGNHKQLHIIASRNPKQQGYYKVSYGDFVSHRSAVQAMQAMQHSWMQSADTQTLTKIKPWITRFQTDEINVATHA